MRKLFSIFFSLSFIFLLNGNQAFAQESALEKSQIVTIDDILLDELTYKNETKLTQIIQISVKNIDLKENNEIVDIKPFISISKSSYTVKGLQEITVPFAYSIPTETKVGSYLNVISISTKGKTDSLAQYRYIFNVQSKEKSFDEILFDSSDIKLEIIQKGLPFILPTQFRYTYTNNSEYTFIPSGEIELLKKSDGKSFQSYKINSENVTLYPGQTITQSYSLNLWSSLESVLETIEIRSTTNNDISNLPITNALSVTILYQLVIIALIVSVLVIAILSSIIRALIRGLKNRKAKELKK
jgi:hypothetical protein